MDLPRPWSFDRSWLTEKPSGDPEVLEAWCYTDRISFRPGETVDLRVHTTASSFSLRIVRDGAEEELVHQTSEIAGTSGVTPENAYEVGCDWPVAHSFQIGTEWRPGLYLLLIRAEREGKVAESEHFLVVRAPADSRRPPIALVLTTSTLFAYNDWGGANSYRGLDDGTRREIGSPIVSTRRPIARGFLRQPPDAPRETNPATPPPMTVPRYPNLEWALLNQYSRHYCNAFWASYERLFVSWAEPEGYAFDFLTQHDLHLEPEVLDDYDGVVIVGHDEYWSWEMRDAIDAFVDGGGRVARFAGNFLWQVRLSADGAQQTCYKIASNDPVHADPARKHLTTTAWDFVSRPGAQTFGLTGLAGIYNRYGSASPRSSGGFTVYRPNHWAFEGTGLCYGDELGGIPSCIATFEVDGLDYTFTKGLPYPTGSDHPPEDLEILAMAPASIGETDWWEGTVPLNAPNADVFEIFEDMFGSDASRVFEDYRHGSGMIASFERGNGSVFTAGSTDWVVGLKDRDPFVEMITRNVLDRMVG